LNKLKFRSSVPLSYILVFLCLFLFFSPENSQSQDGSGAKHLPQIETSAPSSSPGSPPNKKEPLIITQNKLPLIVGNKWTYEIQSSDPGINGKKLIYTIYDKLNYKDKTFYKRSLNIPELLNRTEGLQLLTPQGWFGFWDPEDDMPYDVIMLPLSAGMAWEKDVLLKTPKGEEKRWNKWICEAEETVTVPAGTFPCVKVRNFSYTLDKADDILIWFAPNLGLVKFIERGAIYSLKEFEGKTASSDEKIHIIDKQQTGKLDESVKGAFGGVGIAFKKIEQGILIKEIIPDSPAEKAGLKPGQIIKTIEEKSAANLTIEQTVELLKGPVGTYLKITVTDQNGENLQSVVLARDTIIITHVKSKYINPRQAYIEIRYCNEQTPEKVRNILEECKNKGIRGIILDLKNNSGGLLDSIKQLASIFIGEDRVLWKMQNIGEAEMVSVKSSHPCKTTLPMVVLVSSQTKSGGEILASALKTNSRASILGQKTAGKGTSYKRETRDNGSSVRMPSMHLFSAEGEPIESRGVMPHQLISENTPPEQELEIAKNTLNQLIQNQESGEKKTDIRKKLIESGKIDPNAQGFRSFNKSVPQKVLAFYYPWYGNPGASKGSGKWFHWEGISAEKKQIKNSTHYPALGAYDSHDPRLISAHCNWAKDAGIDGFIASWWGKGSHEDKAIAPLLEGCKKAGLELTVYYETVPNPQTPASAKNDLFYILNRYANHPAWMRLDGKPVIFIYFRAIRDIGLKSWSEVATGLREEYPGSAILLGDKISEQSARVFDGIHTYNTAGFLKDKTLDQVKEWTKKAYPAWVQTAASHGRIKTLTLIPGYDDTKIRKPGLKVERQDGEAYRIQWQSAIEANPDWILLCSWNEWHEGSELEPSVEFGEKYLQLTAQFSQKFKSNK